jgi:hypothetical protein
MLLIVLFTLLFQLYLERRKREIDDEIRYLCGYEAKAAEQQRKILDCLRNHLHFEERPPCYEPTLARRLLAGWGQEAVQAATRRQALIARRQSWWRW